MTRSIFTKIIFTIYGDGKYSSFGGEDSILSRPGLSWEKISDQPLQDHLVVTTWARDSRRHRAHDCNYSALQSITVENAAMRWVMAEKSAEAMVLVA